MILLGNIVSSNIVGVDYPPIKTVLGLWIFENRAITNIINSIIAETASSFLNLRRAQLVCFLNNLTAKFI